jgi:hypothetical protein
LPTGLRILERAIERGVQFGTFLGRQLIVNHATGISSRPTVSPTDVTPDDSVLRKRMRQCPLLVGPSGNAEGDKR